MAGGEPAGGRRAGGRKDGGRLATSADGRHQPPPQLTLALGEGEVRGRQTGSVRAGGGGDPWRRPALVVEAGEERGWRRRRRSRTLGVTRVCIQTEVARGRKESCLAGEISTEGYFWWLAREPSEPSLKPSEQSHEPTFQSFICNKPSLGSARLDSTPKPVNHILRTTRIKPCTYTCLWSR
jgi:hypothetical protein